MTSRYGCALVALAMFGTFGCASEEPSRSGDQTGGMLPPTLALRREREDLDRQVDRKPSERAVREYVAALNEQIRKARVGLMDGPPTLLPPLDADDVVRRWEQRRRRHAL